MTTGHHSRKILSKAEGNVTRKRRTQKGIREQVSGLKKDRKETASMPRMIERIAHPANLETACKKGLYPQTKREEKAPGHPYSR